MIYLDFAATTPIDPTVIESMNSVMQHQWGNPSSPHSIGRDARANVDQSRKKLAEYFSVKSSEVLFTSSGSESAQLAIVGFGKKWEKKHQKKGHIITSAIEHKCVLESVNLLHEDGWTTTYINANKDGVVEIEEMQNAITDDTALVSIQWVNNETGVIQPIEEICAIATSNEVAFHCDASQAIGHLPLPDSLPDLLTVTPHKFYGPKGIGVLIAKDTAELEPLIVGGGQEFGLRSSTENVPAIAGTMRAVQLLKDQREEQESHIQKLCDRLLKRLASISGISINGNRDLCIPGIVNIQAVNKEGETIVMQMDMHNICISTGSACTTGSNEISHVLRSMGQSTKQAKSNIRVSIGKTTTEQEIDIFCEQLQTYL